MFENVLGWMTDDEVKVLQEIASLTPENGVIVEVGSLFGRSSCAWASIRPLSKVICIDVFDEKYRVSRKLPENFCRTNKYPLSETTYNVYEEFLKNTREYPNITHIRGFSPHDIVYTNESIDLFFLDATHSNPNDWENIEFFLPFVKAGGIICGHDYNFVNYPDVVDNVNKLEKITGNKATIYENVSYNSIWMIRR